MTLHESRNEFNFGMSKGKVNKREQIESKEKKIEHKEINNNNSNYNKNSPTTNFSGAENNSTNFSSSNNNNNNINSLPIKRKWIRKISFKSQAGKNESGMIKTNQDSYLIMDNILNNEEFKIFGVLDGHGKI